MQGGWQPPPGGGGYGQPPGGGYGQPPAGGGYGPPAGQPGGYGAPPPGAGPYAPPVAGFGAPAMNYGNYEFSEMENQVIEKAGSRARTWGIISIIIGALQLFGTLGAIANPGLIIYLPQGIIGIIVGVTFLGAGSSLKTVVDTQGNDIPHMMTALQKMGSAFFIQIIVTLIGVLLVAMLVFFVILVGVGSALSR
jgi:hypothetical protein